MQLTAALPFLKLNSREISDDYIWKDQLKGELRSERNKTTAEG